MSKIQKFTTINTTITITNATTLHFNYNKCDYINAPYIFSTAYRCKEYVLLHELQSYSTDKVIEPKTNKEFADGLLTMENPYYVDYYHMLHDKISINKDKDSYLILPHDSYNGDIEPYKDKYLDRFHLFKIDDSSWTEIELDLNKLHKDGLIEWNYFANVMICK